MNLGFYSKLESRVAIPKKERNPATSVTVVRIIDAAVAGSCPRRVNTIGTEAPAIPAATMEITMDMPMTKDKPRE